MGSIITKMAPTGKKKFLDLPQEIRNTVWECAVEPDALQPRVVEVRFGEYRLSKSHDFVADIPPILHACRDSRKIALKVYKSSFGSGHAAHPTYFNPDIDSLFLREPTSGVGFCQSVTFLQNLPDKDQIQHIMLSPYPVIDKFQLSDFPSLRKVTLVKRVEIQPREMGWMDFYYLPHRYHFPLHIYLGSEWDGSHTSFNRTHFLDESELESLGAMWTWPCGHAQSVVKRTGLPGWDQETWLFSNMLEISNMTEGGADGEGQERERMPLKYDFRGAIYDRIPEEQLWCVKHYMTRSRAARVERQGSDTTSSSNST